MPLRYPRACGLKTVYLSWGGISCSFGNSRAFVWSNVQSYRKRQRRTSERTSAAHCTPLARTASMTASTFFNRARTLAFLVVDNFHGVFLINTRVRCAGKSCQVAVTRGDHRELCGLHGTRQTSSVQVSTSRKVTRLPSHPRHTNGG